MAKEVDNPAARDAARQAQQAPRVSKAQLDRSGSMISGGMQQGGATFGKVLQDRMQPMTPIHDHGSDSEGSEEKPEEGKESRSDKGRDATRARPATEQAVREARQSREGRDQSESKEESRDGGKKESTQQAKEAEQRVVGREGRGDSQGQQGSGQQGRGEYGQQGAKQQDPGAAKQKGETKGENKPDTSRALFAQAQQTASAQTAGLSGPGARGQIPQRLLDQIVQFARLITRNEQDKEMEVALRDEVFKGLRLRVRLKDGKLSATFLSDDKEVRDLFQAEKQAISSALAEKGIDVEAINVIMI